MTWWTITGSGLNESTTATGFIWPITMLATSPVTQTLQWQLFNPFLPHVQLTQVPAVINPVLFRPARSVESRKAAAVRARSLLLGELDPAQRAQFDAEGHFIVVGRAAHYRIRRGVAGNIDVLRRDGTVRERLCVHPADVHLLPTEDVMLAQLLHLRHNEREVLRIANRHAAPGDPFAHQHLERAERLLAA